MATAMNTLFRTTGGVVGPTIASVVLAEYLSPLMIQAPRGPVPSSRLSNVTAFNYVPLTWLGISLAEMLVKLFVTSKAGEIEAYKPVEEAASAA
ncbi:MAG: hypothetical protein ACXV2F_01650 [Halobacteriota archaeon]